MKYRKQILRNQKNFTTVYRRGSSRGSRYVVILYRKNHLRYSRLAYVASKKVGNSVQRNRARRLIRESVRTMEDRMVSGYDIIFVARNSINGVKCGDVQRTLRKALISVKLFEAEGSKR